MKDTLTRFELAQSCAVAMSDDPTVLCDGCFAKRLDWLNANAQAHGFADWLVAYHSLPTHEGQDEGTTRYVAKMREFWEGEAKKYHELAAKHKSERIAWVIETGNGLLWLSAHESYTGGWKWAHKIDEALQFSRQEDAEMFWQYAQKHLGFFQIGVPKGSEVRQHAFYEEAV